MEKTVNRLITEKLIPSALVLTACFAVTANSAHDLRPAWVVYTAVLAAAVLLCAAKLFDDKPSIKLPLIIPVGAFFCAVAVSAFFSQDKETSRFELYNAFITILVFYIAANISEPKKAERAVLISSAPLLFFALSIMAGLDIKRLIINDNTLAGYALFWAPIAAVGITSKNRPGWIRKYSFILAAALIICLVYAESIIAYLVIIVFSAYYIPFGEKKYKIYYACAATIALIAAFFFMDGGTILNTLASSASDRLRWWAVSLKMFADKPFFGIGIGAFPNSFLFYKFTTGQNTLFTHNVFLKYLAETGLAGVSCLIFLVYSFVKNALAETRTDFNRTLTASVACAAAFGFFNINLEYFGSNIILAVFAGAFYSGSRTAYAAATPKSALVVLIAVLAALSGYMSAPVVADTLSAKAKLEFYGGEIAKAEYFFAEASRLNPLNADYHLRLSRIAFERYRNTKNTADLNKALQAINQALKLRQKDLGLKKELERYLAE